MRNRERCSFSREHVMWKANMPIEHSGIELSVIMIPQCSGITPSFEDQGLF